MTDQLEHDLADVFGSTAGEADVPHLPLDDVVAQGRALQEVRRRRATLWAAVAAAAAVVAGCLPIAVAAHHSDDRPAPTHGTSSPSPTTPAAPPPTLAYLDGDTLHADGQTFSVGKNVNLVSAGGTVLVGHWGRSITWRILRGGRLVPVPYGTGTNPVLSPDGATAVVSTNPTPQTSRITLYDARSDHETAHVDLDLPATCCDGGSIQGLGIDATGTVYWAEETSGPSAPRMAWRPGSAPVRIQHGDGLFGVTPAGPLIDGALGRAVDGQWQPVATISGENDAWSPSGTTVAEGGPPVFLTPATGHTMTPSLPGVLDQWIGFESETDVLGAVRDGSTTDLVRCNVATGSCAAVEKLPDGWKSWQWATNGPAAVAPDPPTSSISPDDSVIGLGRGDAPSVATIGEGILRIGGRAIAHGVDDAIGSSDQSVFLLVRHGSISAITGAGKETPLPALGGDIREPPPVLSPDGRYAVSVRASDHGDSLVEWSLATDSAVGALSVEGGSQRLRLDGVDDDGRVYATTYAPRAGFTWKPGQARRPISGTLAQLWDAGFDAVGPHGVVDPKDCADQPVAVAPDGGQVLCKGDSPSGYVGVAANGGSVPLQLPVAPKQVLGFRTDDAVLLVVASTGSDWLVTCSVTDGVCSRVMAVPSGVTFARLPGTA